MEPEHAVAKCPICGTLFDPNVDRSQRPFCSERCRLVDLSHWLRGDYAIPGESAQDLPAPDCDIEE